MLEHVLSIEEDSDELNSLAFLKTHGFSEGCRTPSGNSFGTIYYVTTNPMINSDDRHAGHHPAISAT